MTTEQEQLFLPEASSIVAEQEAGPGMRSPREFIRAATTCPSVRLNGVNNRRELFCHVPRARNRRKQVAP